MKPAYERVVLKISGQSLAGEEGWGIAAVRIQRVAEELAECISAGVQLGVVCGGGNIIRGVTAQTEGLNRTAADYMGMLAGVMNALALQDALEKCGINTRVMSAIEIKQVAEPYIRRRAIRHLEKGRAVIFAAGVGSPFFTTDTAGALRAAEIDAEIRRICVDQNDRCVELLKASQDALERVAQALLEHETLTGEDVKTLFDGGVLDKKVAKAESSSDETDGEPETVKKDRPALFPPISPVGKNEPDPEPA